MLHEFNNMNPKVSEGTLAEGCHIIGDVTIGGQCSIWFGAVLRGDDNNIKIGKGTNIQDNAVIHVTGIQTLLLLVIMLPLDIMQLFMGLLLETNA